MDIRNFKTFQSVVDCGGFTKAAQHLGYAQSTVTTHIQELEDYYKKRVFDRIGKTIALTQFGSELIERVKILLHEYDITCNMSQSFEKPRGKLRIGAPESLLLYRVHSIIKEYKELYPEVEVVIVIDVCNKLRERLQNGELDIGFFLLPTVQYHSLSTTVLKQEQFCIITPITYKQTVFEPNDDMQILYTESSSYRVIMENYFASIGFYPKNTLEMNSVEAIKKYVLYGTGITLLPNYSIQEEVKQGLLRTFDCCSYKPYYSQFSVHTNKWINPAMKAFIQLALNNAKDWK